MFRKLSVLCVIAALPFATAGCSSSRSVRFQMVDVESGKELMNGSGTLFRPEYSMFNSKGIKRFPSVTTDDTGEILISGFHYNDIVLLSAPGHRHATVYLTNRRRAALQSPNPPLDPNGIYPASTIIHLDGNPVVVPMLSGEGEVPPELLRMSYPAE